MRTIFLQLLNGSVIAGLMIVAVLLIRAVWRKAPKSFFCFLWAVVALRLIVPFSVGNWLNIAVPDTPTQTETVSAVSTPATDRSTVTTPSVPAQTTVTPTAPTTPARTDNAPSDTTRNQSTTRQASAVNESAVTVTPNTDRTASPAVTEEAPAATVVTPSAAPWSVDLQQELVTAAVIVWPVGMAVLLLYAVIGSIRLHRRVRTACWVKDNLFQSDKIDSPFIMGLFRPRIYLPLTVAETDIPYVLAHEQAHIRRRDYLTKPLAFLLLTVYWLNPLVWVAYVLFCRDVELACDEKVLREHHGYKKAYSMALINCSVSVSMAQHTPLAFGETAVKTRIRNILRYQPPKRFTIVLCAVLVLTLTAASCMTPNPVQVQESPSANTSDGNKDEEPEEVLNPFDWNSDEVQQTIIDRMKAEADAEGKITLKVWCSGDGKEVEKQLVEQFKEHFADSGLTFNIRVNVKGVVDTPDALLLADGNEADVFSIASDQLPMLVSHDILAPVDPFYSDNVKAENQKAIVADAKVNQQLYAYPEWQGNGYYLFYDKRVHDENDIHNIDTLIQKAESRSKSVYFPMDDLWYGISLFLTAGCDIHFDSDQQVQTMAIHTQEGFWAMQSIRDLCRYEQTGSLASTNDLLNGWAHAFKTGTLSAIITGSWTYATLKNAIGADNLGVAKLPTVAINGERKQLCSISQNVMIGVHAKCQAPFTAQTLAYFLGREEAQQQRYEDNSILSGMPTNKHLCETEPLNSDPLLQAIQDQRPYTYPQQTTLGTNAWSLGIQEVIAEQVKTNGFMDNQAVLDALKKWYDQHKDDPSLLLGDTLPETAPSVIEQYHVPGEPFENIEYDTIVQLADMEYQVLYGGLSDADLEAAYQTMYRLIDNNSLWSLEEKAEYKSRIKIQQASGIGTLSPEEAIAANEKIGIDVYPTTKATEEEMRIAAFQHIVPAFASYEEISDISSYTRSLGAWAGFDKYIAEAFLSPPEGYGTLEDFAPYLFDESQPKVLHRNVLGKEYRIAFQFRSGLYDYFGSARFLKGKNEWVTFHSDPHGRGEKYTTVYYHKLVGGKTYSQLIYPGQPEI